MIQTLLLLFYSGLNIGFLQKLWENELVRHSTHGKSTNQTVQSVPNVDKQSDIRVNNFASSMKKSAFIVKIRFRGV